MTPLADRPLEGRVAVVAGASRGRGQGIAVELGAAGATVHLVGRTLGDEATPASLHGTRASIEALGGSAVVHAGDATDPEFVTALLHDVEAHHGRLDIVVHSVFSTPDFADAIGRRMWELADRVWTDAAENPARAAYLLTARAAPLLIRSATPERPTLVVTVSGRGAAGYRYNVAYGVGKAALARLTTDAAIELAPSNVAVVDIWPNGYSLDPERPETPRYSGRAVVALATDPHLMARTGRAFWSAQLGAEFGFTDEFGHRHPVAEVTDAMSRPPEPRGPEDRGDD